MPSFYSDNDDIQFYLERYVQWRPIVDLIEDYEHADAPETWEQAVDTYREIADMIGRFAAEEVAPRAAAMDERGAWLEDGVVRVSPEHEEIFAQLKELGVYGLCTPRELGGLNCPGLLYLFVCEMMARADVSVMTHHSFHGGMAMAMLVYSITEGTTKIDLEKGGVVETRFAKEIEEIARGQAWGCMDITEPNAGSDMAALRTVAEQDAAGNWFVTGQKIFITSGHGKYHFVIARTEKAKGGEEDPFAGLGGLSFFLDTMMAEIAAESEIPF